MGYTVDLTVGSRCIRMGYWHDNGRFVRDVAPEEHWITVHPGGGEGTPVLVSGEKGHYVVKGGMGGKFIGQHLSKIAGKSFQQETTPVATSSSSTVRVRGETLTTVEAVRALMGLRKQYLSKTSLRSPEDLLKEVRLYERTLLKSGINPDFLKEEGWPSPELQKGSKAELAAEKSKTEEPSQSIQKETDLTKMVKVPEWEGQEGSASNWLRILSELYGHFNKTTGGPRERIGERIDSVESALKAAGYEVPHYERTSEEQVQKARADTADQKAIDRLPKTASGEVDTQKLAEALGQDESEIKKKFAKLGGPTQVYISYFNELEKRRKEEAVKQAMARREASYQKMIEVQPAVKEAAKAVSDLGIHIRSLGSIRLPQQYKDAGSTFVLGKPHKIAADAVAEAFKETPDLIGNVSFAMYEMPRASMHAMCQRGIGACISLNTASVIFRNENYQFSKYTVGTEELADLPRDEAIAKYHKIATFHELGHIIDGAQNWALTAEASAILKLKFKSKTKIAEWIRNNISEYAAEGYDPKRGWVEVPSELYAMKRLGKKLPAELEHIKFDEKAAMNRLKDSEFIVATTDAAAIEEFLIEDTFLLPREEIERMNGV